MLRLSDVAVDLGGFALRVDSLEVASGEYLVILGPNGAGKTVLLETIAGLHPVRKGRIEFRDAAAAPPTRPPARDRRARTGRTSRRRLPRNGRSGSSTRTICCSPTCRWATTSDSA